MSFTYIKKMPTPDEIRSEIPLPDSLQTIREKRNQEISDILTGKSQRFLVLVGPCSADNEDSVCEYVTRLAKINEKVNKKPITF